jgi:hypothetical protein
MAGIQVNQNDSWIVASWVHSYTVELLLKYLPSDAPETLKNVLYLDRESGLNFFSLQNQQPVSLIQFLQTTDRIINMVKSGQEQFGTPAIMPEYLNRVEELRRIVLRDPRLQTPPR